MWMCVSPASAVPATKTLVVTGSIPGTEVEGADRTLKALLERANEPSVEIQAAVPSDTAQYRSVWILDPYRALPSTDASRLRAYVRSGGSAHLTGERPCCETANGGVQQFLRSVLNDQDVTIGGAGDQTGPYTFNPNATDFVTQVPNRLTGFYGNGVGAVNGIGGIGGRNVLIRTGDTPTGGVWSEQDMQNGRGRVTVIMDVNWLLDGKDTTETRLAVENIAQFLGNGVARSMSPKEGYRFANTPSFTTDWAKRSGLQQRDLMEQIAFRTFDDVRIRKQNGGSVAKDLDALWAHLDGGNCFGMALSGGRFDAGLDPLTDVADGRAHSQWSVADENDLPAPTAGQGGYAKELLDTLGSAFIAQFSLEFLDEWTKLKNLARRDASTYAEKMYADLVKIFRTGRSDLVNLVSTRATRTALIAFQDGGGHAVLAHGVRRTSDGGYAIDVWDNNEPGDEQTIAVKADGSWTYPPLGWSGKPSSQTESLAAFPLFEPRHLVYRDRTTATPFFGNVAARVPPGVEVTRSANRDGSEPPFMRALTGTPRPDAGGTVMFTSGAAEITIDEGSAEVAFVGGRHQYRASNDGAGPVTLTVDDASGTVTSSGRNPTLTVETDTREETRTGVTSITMSASGAVTSVPVKSTGPSVTPTLPPAGTDTAPGSSLAPLASLGPDPANAGVAPISPPTTGSASSTQKPMKPLPVDVRLGPLRLARDGRTAMVAVTCMAKRGASCKGEIRLQVGTKVVSKPYRLKGKAKRQIVVRTTAAQRRILRRRTRVTADAISALRPVTRRGTWARIATAR